MSLIIEIQQFNREWVEEAHPLFLDHYKEIDTYQDIPLDPDYEKYIMLEEAGKLLTLTARYNGELIGYVIYMIDNALHYEDSLQAHQYTLFVKKDKRKSLLGCGFILLKQSEKILKDMGVQIVYQHL